MYGDDEMKILLAEFTNFKHLYSGLGKYKVKLDFTKVPNKINVIVGKMGSGKTTILGHLQPWASFGTLDERNSDGIVIDGKDGSKKLVFQNGATTYIILHQWTWVKDHHALKSYFKKNDEELNPNGNQSSFKEIVEIEMGIDQSFLRLSRLGPNVSNLIDMTSTERKSFMANLQSDSDLFIDIYKDMMERSRNINSQLHILGSKLINVNDATIKEKNKNLKELRRKTLQLRDDISGYTKKVMRLSEEINVRLSLHGGNIISARNKLKDMEKEYEREIKSIHEERKKLEDMEVAYSDYGKIHEDIGRVESEISRNSDVLLSLQTTYDELFSNKTKLTKMKAMSVSSEYIESLAKTYAESVNTVNEFMRELDNFTCESSSADIKLLMRECQLFDETLLDIFEYRRDIIANILDVGNQQALSSSKKQIEKLQIRKIKLQKKMGNVHFLQSYEVEDPLVIPGTCECYKTCPYYVTHPSNAKKEVDDFGEKLKEISNEIDAIDSRIEQLLEYPTIISKLNHLKSEFTTIIDKIEKLGVGRVKTLRAIVLKENSSGWYDYEALVDILTKCAKREKMYEIQSKLPQMKAELDKYSNVDLADISAKLEEVENRLSNIQEAMTQAEEKRMELTKEKSHLLEVLDAVNNYGAKDAELCRREDSLNKTEEEIMRLRSNINVSEMNTDAIESLNRDLSRAVKEEREATDEFNKLSMEIDDIENSRALYDNLLKKQAIISHLCDATSPSKGIPLIFVKVFLNDCVDIINELISMVFDDTIVIKEFHITEKEFLIPYYKNGREIHDVKSASQGEKAIISLALSFALMRKGILDKHIGNGYNILLLDEIDGALYSEDRQKFLMILAQQMKAINAEQVFLITHNNSFDGYPVNIIMTTPETIDNKETPVLYV